MNPLTKFILAFFEGITGLDLENFLESLEKLLGEKTTKLLTSDFHCMDRQQEVLQAIFWRMLSLDALARIPELYDLSNWLAETDIQLGDILPLMPLATQLAADPSRIQTYAITPPLVNDWRIAHSGAYVLLPNRDDIYEMLQNAFMQ